MSANQEGNLKLEGHLTARVIKHGPVKRFTNRVRRPKNITTPTEVDLLKTMRG